MLPQTENTRLPDSPEPPSTGPVLGMKWYGFLKFILGFQLFFTLFVLLAFISAYYRSPGFFNSGPTVVLLAVIRPVAILVLLFTLQLRLFLAMRLRSPKTLRRLVELLISLVVICILCFILLALADDLSSFPPILLFFVVNFTVFLSSFSYLEDRVRPPFTRAASPPAPEVSDAPVSPSPVSSEPAVIETEPEPPPANKTPTPSRMSAEQDAKTEQTVELLKQLDSARLEQALQYVDFLNQQQDK